MTRIESIPEPDKMALVDLIILLMDEQKKNGAQPDKQISAIDGVDKTPSPF